MRSPREEYIGNGLWRETNENKAARLPYIQEAMRRYKIERVARVIAMEMYGGYPVGEINMDSATRAQWQRSMKLAEAVIKEMRE
ncbi:hypothetical protein CHR56_15905 [Rhizobium leguminosarum bv. viciae]|nr:hypothetical protein CHR56_15905 [Rhizobium leguminosarum bv. viciae]